jgi:hypothetical protein
MSPARPLRELTADEIVAFVDDGVICARNVMLEKWLEVVAEAIERNLKEPTCRGRLQRNARGGVPT